MCLFDKLLSTSKKENMYVRGGNLKEKEGKGKISGNKKYKQNREKARGKLGPHNKAKLNFL